MEAIVMQATHWGMAAEDASVSGGLANEYLHAYFVYVFSFLYYILLLAIYN